MIVALAQAGPGCGGKAEALGAMRRAGLPVPDGFVVKGEASLAEITERVTGPVAVRSSGLAEDSATASFAGILATVLGPREPAEVLAAIDRCAASARSDRASAYRRHFGLGAEETMAVIVQNLVAAESAGVLFTRDPRTGAEATVINASWGLGDSVVSGVVTPDEIVVTADQTRITLGRKDTRLDLREGKLSRTAVAPADRDRPCLAAAQIAELVALGRRCEVLFGQPQDVEWAFDRQALWVLQSRPITTISSRGVPSSPGRAQGPARVVRSADDFGRVRPGDILVCRTTDPAWTPLFRVAAGVVTETGGMLCHAAIVAREYAIPAVVGVAAATSTFTDGELITVDGESGTVTALERP